MISAERPSPAPERKPIRIMGWCDAHNAMAEGVQRVEAADGEPRCTHACPTCRKRLGLTATQQEPGKARPIR